MSCKRFWYDFEDCNGHKFVDFKTDKEYSLETIGDFRNIEDLLNELNDENKQLRFDFNEMKGLLHSLEDENEKLEDENKELQKQVILFKTRRKDVEDLIIKNSVLIKENTNLQVELLSQSEEVEILSEKNKELKQELFEVSKELLWATSDEVDRVLYYEDEVEELRKEIFK